MSQKITRIELQKKSKNRYSVFCNGEFKLGVSTEVLLQFGLFKDMTLSDALIEKITSAEKWFQLREQALHYLARRPHSEKELRDKLINKKFEKNLIAVVLKDLKEKKYIDDETFSRLLIREEMNLKKNGPLLIKNKLFKKGVQLELISEIIDKQYSEQDQLENCKYLADKKVKLINHLPQTEQKKKLAAFLKQKGFNWRMINAVVLEKIAEEDENVF